MSDSFAGEEVSHPGSRPSSRPASPQTPAEVRSHAIAKLKRAASLPRKDGRRPSQDQAGPSPNLMERTPTQNDMYNNGNNNQAGPSTLPEPHQLHPDEEEMLSPSPIQATFGQDVTGMYPGGSTAPAFNMQRSYSETSSFQMNSAPGTPLSHQIYQKTPSPSLGSEWPTMQLAQPYIPSLTPPGGSSPFVAGLTAIPGRNTPSPLPTLGDLRNLQRSNSAAARANAMNKLTGGRDTPKSSDEEGVQPLVRPGLKRAGTTGASHHHSRQMTSLTPPMTQEEDRLPHTAGGFAEARPRLQRSFTVSSTNMGEERRSAVGRRMVMRLGERRAARQQEEAEVRRLWEERRGIDHGGSGEPGDAEEEVDEEDDEGYGTDTEAGKQLPNIRRISPTEPPVQPSGQYHYTNHLGLPEIDRPASRSTANSEEGAFEYEAHLRRSLSSRTARGAVGAVTEPVPQLGRPINEVEHLEPTPEHPDTNHSTVTPPEMHNLDPPKADFATPIKHSQQSSSSIAQDMYSPGAESSVSRDGLTSMMFILGGTDSEAQRQQTGRRPETSWPVGVRENGSSEWGTPGKDGSQPGSFHDSTAPQSPLAQGQTPHSSYAPSEADLTPPAISQRASIMSWEEVGGEADREVPTDPTFHKKSGSISAKLGRTVKNAMRKRSPSRSSAASSATNPGSPRPGDSLSVSASYSRRESEASISPSSASVARKYSRTSPQLQQGEFIRHQPSLTSLAGQPESSANSILLQHQLSSEPSPVSAFLPRADLNDPRIHSSKLSPFPGMSQLEGGHRLVDPQGQGPPKLVHQSSDSGVPSLSKLASTGQDNIYTLPLPIPIDSSQDKRASDDSISKKSWLARMTSPRSSLTAKRKSSNPDLQNRKYPADIQVRSASPTVTTTVDSDPFAGPPPPSSATNKLNRHMRPASPSVSVVHEVSEEGSRFTRFTTNMRELNQPSPLAEVHNDHYQHSHDDDHLEDRELPSKSMEVLKRMDDVLALGPDDPGRPEVLDDPPRKLLLATQVLQVVNVHTAKDRFLFLFNDILVITKPLITSGINATLDMKFVVKSIVPLDQLRAYGFSDDSLPSAERDALVAEFVEHFKRAPKEACESLYKRNRWEDHTANLAAVIFKAAELDKTQLGLLLADNEDDLMKAFIDLFHFRGVHVLDALRMFLLSLRLPGESLAAERLLRGLASRYHEANQTEVSWDKDLTSDLILAIMQLNDAMYGGRFGFAMHNSGLRPDIFISSWRSKDPNGTVEDDILNEIYASLKRNQLAQALSSSELSRARELEIEPSKLPSKLTYGIWSEIITIRIPNPDQNFAIQLIGEGLEFDVPVLEFLTRNKATFRVRGVALGPKSVLFNRIGENAALYASLGNAHVFNVERAFMRYTFNVAFSNHIGVRRKYCFSVTDPTLRTKWHHHLPRQILATRHAAKSLVQEHDKVKAAASAVALTVLRDALIPPIDDRAITGIAPIIGPIGSIGTNGHAANSKSKSIPEKERRGSVSIAYGAIAAGEEALLGPLQASKPGNQIDKIDGMLHVQTGKELVLVCRQNSLLPAMLELLQAGVVDDSKVRNGNRV